MISELQGRACGGLRVARGACLRVSLPLCPSPHDSLGNSKQPLPSNLGEPIGPTGPRAQDEPSGHNPGATGIGLRALGKDAPPRRGTRSGGAPFPGLGLWTKWGPTGCLVRTSRESCSRQRPCQCAGGQGPRPQSASRGHRASRSDEMRSSCPYVCLPHHGGPPCGPRVPPGTDPWESPIPRHNSDCPQPPCSPTRTPAPLGTNTMTMVPDTTNSFPRGPCWGWTRGARAWGHLCL